MNIKDRILQGRQTRPMRNLIYGVEKVGKSEFASRFPNPLFIAFEDGTSGLDTARIQPNDWVDGINILADLYNNPGHGYQTINIDSMGWAEMQCSSFICKQNNVEYLEEIEFGKWKGFLFDEFAKLLDWLTLLYGQGMHINLIAHSDIKKFKNPSGMDYDRYSVQMKVSDLGEKLKQYVDNILFMNFDDKGEEVKQGTQKKIQGTGLSRRFLHTKRTPAYDAGVRITMPDRIELTPTPQEGYDNFIQHWNEWVKAGAAA